VGILGTKADKRKEEDILVLLLRARELGHLEWPLRILGPNCVRFGPFVSGRGQKIGCFQAAVRLCRECSQRPDAN
jgi:hypothetical protein